ncbi:MAG: N-6 DNA methylase [Candidatus Bathyarchaeota archaeon]|nr:N-6 DNA methylase [Candidatus Bathyarchaeota archaeon]
MIPKPTEDTVTNLLANELEKYQVKTETFPTISTPGGIRKPDVWCVNSGAYPIEAKFKEGDLINAIAKVQNDYLKWYDVLGIKGGFAILYPEELSKPMHSDVLMKLAHEVEFKAVAMFPPKDTRKSFTVYKGTLSEIAKILAEHVLAPPDYVEPSTDYIIKALRDSATYITVTLKYLSGKELEDIFGGEQVFKNILQYEEQRYPLESLRLASAYLLINQLLFYQVLSRRMPDKFPEIDADHIRRPADLNDYFKTVLNVNYKTIFSYDVASRIFTGFTDQIRAVINVIKGLGPEKVGGDLLGTIFHDLVPLNVRKNVAAFYTNVLAAELLAWLSVDTYDAKVADLAVGSGGLLVAAYRRKRHLLENEREFTAEDHRRFAEQQLLGIDIMPFAANVAACHLSLQSPEYFTNRVNVAIWDSTELEPDQRIPSIAALEFVMKGQASLEGFMEAKPRGKGVVSLTGETAEEIQLENYDVVMMNPPFTRQERMPKQYKVTLNDRFKDYPEQLHGQMGYYGYFILLSDRFLEENGTMALVLPATALHARSTTGIRKLWSEKYHIKYIIATWQRLAFSESVLFREVLLVGKRMRPPPTAVTKVCVLKKLPDRTFKAREVANRIRTVEQDYEDDEIVIKIHPYSKFTEDITDWHRFISLSNLKLADLLQEALSSDRLTFLSSISKTERSDLEHFKFRSFHGFILNDVKRLKRRNDHWFLHRIEHGSIVARHRKLRHRVQVPADCLARALRRHSYVDTIDVSENSDHLILAWFDKIKEMARYPLSSKELETLDKKIVGSWKRKFERRKAHLLLSRRLFLSSPGTCAIAFYSEEPVVGINFWSLLDVEREDAKIIALWLNSSLSILQLLYIGVACEGPWMTLHSYMLNNLSVLNPKKITKEERKRLLKIFDEIKNISLPSITEQLSEKNNVRKTIDKALFDILGYENITEEFLENFHTSILHEIEAINRLIRAKNRAQ